TRSLGRRGDAGRLLDVVGRGRGLGDEGEALVLIDGDHRRQGRALHFLLGARVELLDEAHDVDAALAQRRADRGRRRGVARGHLQLDVAENLLGHWSLLTVALNSIRTGEPWSWHGCLPRIYAGEPAPPLRARRACSGSGPEKQTAAPERPPLRD